MDLGLGLLKDAFGIVSRVANRQADDLLIYDLKWPEKIGLKKDLEAKGYRINWSRLDEIHDRLQEGYEFVARVCGCRSEPSGGGAHYRGPARRAC